ncbi:MAG TPA: type I DNA topoisomerase [Armatimonadota bacterium]|nr:type I DNA topoisomerase [Armatimonadota bacterium]
MAKSLIIVESPAKTRTIGRFLGKRYALAASMGHVRDLPKSTLGVDVDHDFKPKYVNLRDRAAALKKLRAAVAEADEVYLATDPDREGEAIAWHLAEALKIKDPKRIEFNEITRSAVTHALEHPRDIDPQRVDAQQARRILDRLVGYSLSPLLQRKMNKWGLSAGRVQSVAVRLICEREREIQAFVPQEFWDITAFVTPGSPEDAFQLKLVQKDGKKLAIGDQAGARRAAAEIWESALRVAHLKESTQARRPPPPYITSTLQQDGANRLGLSARQTMRVAQQLYEGVELGDEGPVGLITYMRTDSPRVAAEAQTAAREVIAAQFGEEYLPEKPRHYASRRGAQEAHEAIRPTYPDRTPDQVAPFLDDRQRRLYELIWSRFMASQMADLRLLIKAVDVSAGPYVLRGRGVKVLFPGFTRVYPTRDAEVVVPDLREGMLLHLVSLAALQRFTEPAARYSEASLVRALEAQGIGRPSTYAPIIGTIQDRGYVYLEEKKFHPTDLGFVVTDQLVAHFPDIINVEFTAAMESELDQIEEGKAEWVEIIRTFYEPFSHSIEQAEEKMEKLTVQPQETDEVCEECGQPMLLRVGRRGPFLACSGYPECKHTRPAPGSKEEQRPPPEPTDEVCDKCDSPMVIRTGRRGRFLACSGYPKCKNTRPLPEEEAKLAKLAEGQTCDQCGKPMAARQGRFGVFLGCTGYPDCKGIKRLPKDA